MMVILKIELLKIDKNFKIKKSKLFTLVPVLINNFQQKL
jgi:hypothetical protein